MGYNLGKQICSCGGGKPMGKTLMGRQTLVYPMSVLLIGAIIDNKPNFVTTSWSGIACSELINGI